MTINTSSNDARAWYSGSRADFLKATGEDIANKLLGRAVLENYDIQIQQQQEWRESVSILQKNISRQIPVLREALAKPEAEPISHVILEYDFKRRGLRIDCVLIARGVIFVIEFKRSQISATDRDQVMRYAVNLIEFHQETRLACEREGVIVVPIIALTAGRLESDPYWTGFGEGPWVSVANKALESDRRTLLQAISIGLANRRTDAPLSAVDWLSSNFYPSSSILDAALSLYGNHDVSAINEHAASQQEIASCVEEISAKIGKTLRDNEKMVIILSGAPGAGKTLVGLDLALRGPYAKETTFVTGNAPLIDVLTEALQHSYKKRSSTTPTGYRRKDMNLVAEMATYKLVKAHQFINHNQLISQSSKHGNTDGRVIVFDEAQRTYEKGRKVLGSPLPKHEAELVLELQQKTFPTGGKVVVALIGHNQAINKGERGLIAWLEAADKLGWKYCVSDQTLTTGEIETAEKWLSHHGREKLHNGHLSKSLRFYRNAALEQWAAHVVTGAKDAAEKVGQQLGANNHEIYLTRSLARAREWARKQVISDERVGIIASSQGRRLAAEGLFVEMKPDIASWMLLPTSDIRSSNALETVQNQYQVQGLELDYCIVCWDLDLRWTGNAWGAQKINGSDWKHDNSLQVAKNGYRVLLTRARRGMIIFVPMGDLSGSDITRPVAEYDRTARYLVECGARLIE
jgi:hypothetical protein